MGRRDGSAPISRYKLRIQGESGMRNQQARRGIQRAGGEEQEQGGERLDNDSFLRCPPPVLAGCICSLCVQPSLRWPAHLVAKAHVTYIMWQPILGVLHFSSFRSWQAGSLLTQYKQLVPDGVSASIDYVNLLILWSWLKTEIVFALLTWKKY